MKKYEWVNILIFAILMVTCVFLASKNEAVREVFIKSVNEIDFCIGQLAEKAKTALL